MTQRKSSANASAKGLELACASRRRCVCSSCLFCVVLMRVLLERNLIAQARVRSRSSAFYFK